MEISGSAFRKPSIDMATGPFVTFSHVREFLNSVIVIKKPYLVIQISPTQISRYFPFMAPPHIQYLQYSIPQGIQITNHDATLFLALNKYICIISWRTVTAYPGFLRQFLRPTRSAFLPREIFTFCRPSND